MVQTISRLNTLFARLAAWLFFAIGCIIIYEVVARYVFVKPTIWVEEMSRFLQIWATYLSAAYVLHHRHLIAIRVVQDRLPAALRTITELFTLAVVGLFSLVAVYHGAGTVMESIRIGRASSTMLGVPLWMTEIAIPVGFGLLFLQVLAEAFALLAGGREHTGEVKR